MAAGGAILLEAMPAALQCFMSTPTISVRLVVANGL